MSAATLNTTQIARVETQPVGAQPKTLAQRIGEATRTCFEVLRQLKETASFVFNATRRAGSLEASLCTLPEGTTMSFIDKVRLGWAFSKVSSEERGSVMEVLRKLPTRFFIGLDEPFHEGRDKSLIVRALTGQSVDNWNRVWLITLQLGLTTEEFRGVLRAYLQTGFTINKPVTVGAFQPTTGPLLALIAGGENLVGGNSWDKVLVLLEEPGIDVNVSDTSHHDLPLHHAAYHGRLDVVQGLIGKGANREAKGCSYIPPGLTSQREGITALEIAAISGHLDVVEFLMAQEGATLDRLSIFLGVGLRRELDKAGPLVTEERVARFISCGLTAEGNDGCLLAAAGCKNFKVAKRLLALGCNPFVHVPRFTSTHSYTPSIALNWTIGGDREQGQELLELFLQDERLDLNAELVPGCSVLEHAIGSDVSERTYLHLLQKGARISNLNRVYHKGRTLLGHYLDQRSDCQRGLQALATVPADDWRIRYVAQLQTRIERLRDLGASETPEENPR